MIGFRGVAVDDADRFALEVISQLLAGQGGRLFLELRDRQGLAYSVTATSVEGVAPGYFAVYIATAPEKLEAARAGLLDQLDRLLETEPRDAELEAARRHLIGQLRDRPPAQRGARARRPASTRSTASAPAASRAYPEQIRAVTGEDVLRVARRIVDLDAYTEAVVRGDVLTQGVERLSGRDPVPSARPSRRGSLPPVTRRCGSPRSPRRPTSRARSTPPRGRARAAPSTTSRAVAGSRKSTSGAHWWWKRGADTASRRVHAVVDHVQDREQRRADDARPARAARHHEQLAAVLSTIVGVMLESGRLRGAIAFAPRGVDEPVRVGRVRARSAKSSISLLSRMPVPRR